MWIIELYQKIAAFDHYFGSVLFVYLLTLKVYFEIVYFETKKAYANMVTSFYIYFG